ncbi:hypothetical protein ACWDA3_27755 [Nonomuraea rubra]
MLIVAAHAQGRRGDGHGRRPVFDVAVDLTNADGAVVAALTVTWTLKPKA